MATKQEVIWERKCDTVTWSDATEVLGSIKLSFEHSCAKYGQMIAAAQPKMMEDDDA